LEVVAVMMRVFSLLRMPPNGVANSSKRCKKYLTSSGWSIALTSSTYASMMGIPPLRSSLPFLSRLTRYARGV
jgi:hypothetical protein